jgi:hypothetical protein
MRNPQDGSRFGQFVAAYLGQGLPIRWMVSWVEAPGGILDLTQLTIGASHQDSGMSLLCR